MTEGQAADQEDFHEDDKPVISESTSLSAPHRAFASLLSLLRACRRYPQASPSLTRALPSLARAFSLTSKTLFCL